MKNCGQEVEDNLQAAVRPANIPRHLGRERAAEAAAAPTQTDMTIYLVTWRNPRMYNKTKLCRLEKKEILKLLVYKCSVSRWRPHKVDKRMVLEYTHGLFIT